MVLLPQVTPVSYTHLTIAGETAKALSALFDVTLVYCFEKKGVLRDENDDDSVIPRCV